jgi:hypothetical protein
MLQQLTEELFNQWVATEVQKLLAFPDLSWNLSNGGM